MITTLDARMRRTVSESPFNAIKRGAYAASGRMVSRRNQAAADWLPRRDLLVQG
jgi:hypothetical protein